MDRPVVLVTGASRGIGAAVARLASRAGYAVAIGYRSDAAAAEAVLAELDGPGATIGADVGSEAAHGGRGGAIVNVSSAASRLGSAGEYVDYAASKGALDTLTIGLSLEVAGEGIRVNAVRPGFINTDIHARGGDPERLARLTPRSRSDARASPRRWPRRSCGCSRRRRPT